MCALTLQRASTLVPTENFPAPPPAVPAVAPPAVAAVAPPAVAAVAPPAVAAVAPPAVPATGETAPKIKAHTLNTKSKGSWRWIDLDWLPSDIVPALPRADAASTTPRCSWWRCARSAAQKRCTGGEGDWGGEVIHKNLRGSIAHQCGTIRHFDHHHPADTCTFAMKSP